MPDPDVGWERRQAELPDAWALAFEGADLRGSLLLAFHPTGVRYEATFTGEGRPYVVVRELDIAPPRSPVSWGIRAEGLWADMNCETPFDHWSYGLEAFGLAVVDPDDARGDPVPLGFDLEWEASGPLSGGQGSYAQPGVVHGDILVGPEAIAFDGTGVRRHAWGGATAGAGSGGRTG